jgi:ABC-type antimicrobial peptide transport system permease subunit
VGSPYEAAPALRNAVQRLDRDEPLEHVTSAADALATEAVPARVAAVLVNALAVLALLLAAIGLYGVVAYAVGRRVREFGIRMAVGATSGDVLRLVLKQAAYVTLGGSLLGIASAAASTGLLRSVLWGTDPLDPWVFAASAAVLVGVMFAAAIVPARRAARIDPQSALRDE